MLQDYIRTTTFQRAILDNHADFQGKVGSYTSYILASEIVNLCNLYTVVLDMDTLCKMLIPHNPY